MSDRSDEVTASREPAADSGSESRSTDELLEETERLLGESGAKTETKTETDSGVSDLDLGPGSHPDPDLELEDDPRTSERADGPDSSGRSWLPSVLSRDSATPAESEPKPRSQSRTRSLLSRLSLSYYFSPKAFLAFALTVGAGLFAGGVAIPIPIAGRLLGVLAITFLLGLATSRRRYAEMTAVGISVGAVSALTDHAILTFASALHGSTAVGIATGLLACLIGYYFGRDLRSGLSRDVD